MTEYKIKWRKIGIFEAALSIHIVQAEGMHAAVGAKQIAHTPENK